MADPVSWAMMAAAAASSVSQLVGGVQAYNQGKYEADVAGQNAKIAVDNAARARLDASMAEEAHMRQLRKELGRAAASASQSGVAAGGPGVGSYGAINSQSAREGMLDALNIRYGGETEAHAHEVEAVQFRAERKAAIQRAKGGLLTGVLGAGASALSGYGDYRVARQQMANMKTTPATAPRTVSAATTRRRHYSTLPRPGRY